MIDPALEGRVAIVTGANQGIGAATARALAAQGTAVFITYLRLSPSEQDLSLPEAYAKSRTQVADGVVEAITSKGSRALAWEADLTDPATVSELFDRAEAAFGPVEILVNNADAWAADTFLHDTTDHFGRRLVPVSAETHDRHFLVNSRATALLIAEFARRHRERNANWGRIISLTTGGSAGFPGEVSYGASKNALESYTMAAAWELGRFGITANVLCPPATDTGWITPQAEAEIIRASPLGHVGQPDEVAELIVFLASHQARFVTGQKLTMR